MRRILKHVGHPFLVWFLDLSYFGVAPAFFMRPHSGPYPFFGWLDFMFVLLSDTTMVHEKRADCFSGDGYSVLSMVDGCENMDHPHWPLR